MVETVKLLNGTIGFYADAGEHQLTMKYRPDCLYIGVIMNITGLVLFIGICILDHFIRKDRIKAGREIYSPVIYEELPIDAVCFEAALEESDPTPQSKENEN